MPNNKIVNTMSKGQIPIILQPKPSYLQRLDSVILNRLQKNT